MLKNPAMGISYNMILVIIKRLTKYMTLALIKLILMAKDLA